MKRAILCMGAESTGTRLMCRIFNAAGFYGKESGNYFDQYLPVEKDRLVWHRTYPLDGYGHFCHRWVGVDQMAGPLIAAGFEINAVVMTRDWHCVIESQLKARHSRSYEESWERLQKAYPMIFDGLRRNNISFVTVTYESLIQNGKQMVNNMMKMLNIDPPVEIEEIVNGNTKYYQ